ncbi:MAG: hypothetical protein DSY80_00650 [Desulfocapsa sp.]|nr:MAG: hypothetical protein DSY80_00650 [Desulfocapsa sp.]
MRFFKKTFKEPLHITISVLFTVLILLVGFVLSLYSYRKNTHIVISATQCLFKELANEVAMNFEITYGPVTQVVSLLSYTEAALNGSTIEHHLDIMPLFVDALRHTPAISGIQVGYKNGDYFIVRPLSSDYARTLFAAPEDAMFVFDDVRWADSDSGTLQRIYFNRNLQEIKRLNPVVTDYNPTRRPWYQQALESSSVVSTSPYFFYFFHKVGVTLARQVNDGSAVVAADVTLEQIEETMSRVSFSSSEEKVLMGRDGKVFVHNGQFSSDGETTLPSLEELDSGVLQYVAGNIKLMPGELHFSFQGKEWIGMVSELNIGHNLAPMLLLLVPADDLLVEARRVHQYSFLLTLLTLGIAIPITWFISRRISLSIRKLAEEARRVSRFDFDSSIAISSRITEVAELVSSMQMMQRTVSHFITLIQSIASEQDFETTLKRITQETMVVSKADMVVGYLVDDEQGMLVPDVVMDRRQGSIDATILSAVPLADFLLDPEKELTPSRIGPGQHDDMGGLAGLLGTAEFTVVPIPLVERGGNPIGLLLLLYEEMQDKGELANRLSFAREFSGFAAVSLETRELLNKQKQLVESFIGLLAGAIDAKSAYTGGHCQRVPIITEMLAQAACSTREGPFKDFTLSDEEREELHIASWLHDCGKVTTPEYVVDKATKLETIYNRIHEIRTRFEVLKRDAEIEFWQQVSEGGDREALRKRLEKSLQQLDDDFSFVASCNSGDAFLSPEHIERLRFIAKRTWLRTLDDRLGLSWQEMELKDGKPQEALPVREHLLADKPEHCIPRPAGEQMLDENSWGFKLKVPQYLYNLGELYNLQIERGTLTSEERYKINDHIVQTIMMLNRLPFPGYLKRVPEIAGCHHETMNGTGYPRRLTGEQMSLTGKMMAIADIFEALTASDRPYKKAKKLSEALRILYFMKKDQHIDPQLFDLFLTSGVYLEYAEKYLDPEQIDEVDISDYLG